MSVTAGFADLRGEGVVCSVAAARRLGLHYLTRYFFLITFQVLSTPRNAQHQQWGLGFSLDASALSAWDCKQEHAIQGMRVSRPG